MERAPAGKTAGPMTHVDQTIVLRGELDLPQVRTITAALSAAVGDATRDVVVDVREVTFLDSTALGALLLAAQRLRRQGRPLTLVVAEGPVTALLELSGVADHFRLTDQPPAAAPA